jgi:hypothetical protein
MTELTSWQRHRIEVMWITTNKLCTSAGCKRGYIDKMKFIEVMSAIVVGQFQDKHKIVQQEIQIDSLQRRIAELEGQNFVAQLQIPVAIVATEPNETERGAA